VAVRCRGFGLIWACRCRSGSCRGARCGAPLGLFALWFALSLYLACVGPGRRGHHFMPVLPSLGLLALYLPHRISGEHGLCATMTARPTWTVVVTLFAYGLGQLALGQAHELGRCWQRRRAGARYRMPSPRTTNCKGVRCAGLRGRTSASTCGAGVPVRIDTRTACQRRASQRLRSSGRWTRGPSSFSMERATTSAPARPR